MAQLVLQVRRVPWVKLDQQVPLVPLALKAPLDPPVLLATQEVKGHTAKKVQMVKLEQKVLLVPRDLKAKKVHRVKQAPLVNLDTMGQQAPTEKLV